jgi:hypothetical protein
VSISEIIIRFWSKHWPRSEGNLTKAEAEDMLDFTTELLDRLYTQPKKLELAKERKIARRKHTS